jgi:outer membrane protein
MESIMKSHLVFLFLAWPLLFFPGNGAAAGSNQTLCLTLPHAVALALADNPDIALYLHRQQSATISVEAARSQYLPSLQGSASGSENFRQQTTSGWSDPYQNADLQLTASLNLFNGFADTASLDAARQKLLAAGADVRRQQQVLAFTVASRFIAVLSTNELVKVAAQNLKSQQELARQIEAFYQAGVRTLTDFYQQQAATSQAEFDLLDAERNQQISKLQLLQALGRVPPVSIEVLPPDTGILIEELEDLELATVFEQALATRSDLLAQQKQIVAARQQIRVAEAGYLPSLDFQAVGGSSYSSASGDENFTGQLDDNRGASLALKLAIPIFDRDQTRSSVAQARIGAADAASNLLKLEQQIGLEVGQALADYQRVRRQLVTTGHQLEYARQALDASEARYRVGAATWSELSIARTTYVQAQGAEVRARYAVLLQGLNIGYTRGDLDALLSLFATQETSS